MAANELERVSLNISKESKDFFIKLAKAIHGDREIAQLIPLSLLSGLPA